MTVQRATVLVVDDEESLRRLVSRALLGVGFAVLEADNGATALRLLAGPGPVHLVISDIHMPVMDGIAFARELRLLRPQLPILFITGRESPGLTGEILLKPFGPDALVVAVSRLLSRPAAAPESTPH
jgi:CheY-like chemotaxis protein